MIWTLYCLNWSYCSPVNFPVALSVYLAQTQPATRSMTICIFYFWRWRPSMHVHCNRLKRVLKFGRHLLFIWAQLYFSTNLFLWLENDQHKKNFSIIIWISCFDEGGGYANWSRDNYKAFEFRFLIWQQSSSCWFMSGERCFSDLRFLWKRGLNLLSLVSK